MRIVIDSSAIVAILTLEADAQRLADCLHSASTVFLSTGSYLETNIVLSRRLGALGRQNMTDLLGMFSVRIVPFDKRQSDLAVDAFNNFGKGSGHRANLNFGDCFAYALARTRDLPLLFKGGDFVHTDVQPALKPA